MTRMDMRTSEINTGSRIAILRALITNYNPTY